MKGIRTGKEERKLSLFEHDITAKSRRQGENLERSKRKKGKPTKLTDDFSSEKEMEPNSSGAT